MMIVHVYTAKALLKALVANYDMWQEQQSEQPASIQRACHESYPECDGVCYGSCGITCSR